MSPGTDWDHPLPPCDADGGDGKLLTLVANLAESLHIFHDGPADWRRCMASTCLHAQEVVNREPADR